MNSKLRKFLVVFSFFGSLAVSAAPIQVGLSPDNSQALLLSVINGARTSLLVNIYEISSPVIADAIIAQVNKGTAVRFLMEGEPTGQMKLAQKDAAYAIRKAMLDKRNPDNQFSIMWDGKKGTIRRFVFDHAKYVVADGAKTLVSSENFGPSGHATAGNVGNRGWEIVVEDSALSRQMTDMFTADASATNRDIVDFLKNDVAWDVAFSEEPAKPGVKRTVPTIASKAGTATQVKLAVSPRSEDELVEFIRSANTSLDIEFMDLPSTWKLPSERMSPIIEAAIAAARRGVQVRVLMNDANAFAKPTAERDTPAAIPRNEITARLLRTTAACESIPIQAKIVSVKNVQISYIHNKGLLVDRKRVFVSSINGTQNSVENNREVALVVDSPDAGAYYGQAFDFDWQKSPEFTTPNLPCN